MTYKLLKLLAVTILTLCIITGVGAAAESLSIDTTGLTGTVGETIAVPVKITVEDSIYSFDLQFKTGETEDYKIVFNESTMGRLIYNQESGKVTQLDLRIDEDTILFYLDVTPKTAKNVDLSILSATIRTGSLTSVTVLPYTITGATLTVAGSSSGSGEGGNGGDKPSGSSPGSSSGGSTIQTATPTPTPTTETYTVSVAGGGAAGFSASEVVFNVALPDTYYGDVTLTLGGTTEAPAGKTVYHAADITINPALPAGETAVIHFKIPLADLQAKGYGAADVCLYHYDKATGIWTALPTVYMVVGDTVYYESYTTGFSPFVIVYEIGGATPKGGVVPTETTPQPTATKPTKSPFSVLAVMAGLGACVLMRRK